MQNHEIELQVGVKVLLKNKQGKYLLLRRNPKKYPEVGPKWDIVGGRTETGSSLIENLKREIKEEVGLDYIGEPKLVAAQDIIVHRFTDSTNDTDKKPRKEIEKHVVRLTYTGEIEGEPVVNNNDNNNNDNLEAKWFTTEEIKNIKTNELDSYFQKLLENDTIRLS